MAKTRTTKSESQEEAKEQKPQPKKDVIKLDSNKLYSVIGLKGSKHLTEGKEYNGLSSQTAEILVSKGYAKLID